MALILGGAVVFALGLVGVAQAPPDGSIDPLPREESPLLFLGPILAVFGLLILVIIRSLARLERD